MNSTQRNFPVSATVTVFFLMLFLLTGFGNTAAEQTFWEGRITTAPYGMLPGSGLYAASNAFPLDSKVVVTDAEGKNSIQVRIIERLDVDRVFMQVSPEAAKRLNLQTNEILIARVSPVRDESSIVDQGLGRETPYSRDPDVNPSGASSDDGLSVIREYLGEEEPAETAEATADQVPVEIEQMEEPAPSEPSEPATPVAEEPLGLPAEAADAAGAEISEPELEETVQQKAVAVHDIPDKTGQPEKYDYVLPPPQVASEAGEDDVTAEATGVETVIEDEPTVVAMEPIFPAEKDYSYSPSAPERPEPGMKNGPVASMDTVEPGISAEEPALAAMHAPEPPKAEAPVPDLGSVDGLADIGDEETVETVHDPILPEEGSDVAAAQPAIEEPSAEIPDDAELVLVPAEDRPPEGPSVTVETEKEAPPVEEPERRAPAITSSVIGGPVAVHSNLERKSYYLQVGAYSKIESAQNNAVTLSARYPVMIYSDMSAAAPYKLMIGPLNEDESDTLLFTLSSLGYSDAFVRRGN